MIKNISTSDTNTPFNSETIGFVLFAIAYWISVRLGLLLVAQPEGVASIWPASGLALAAFLLIPKQHWLKLAAVIFLTNVAGNYWSGGNSLLVSLGFALANTLEAFLGAWILEYFCGSRVTFERASEVIVLLGVAVLSNGGTALLGAAVSALAFGAPFLNTWLLWWASDGLGILLVSPVIICWANIRNLSEIFSVRKLAEVALLAFILITFALLVFGPFNQAGEPFLRNYMLFPLLLWLAFRFTPREMANALLVFAVIAIWNTLQGYGIFAVTDQTRTEHLISLQMYLCVAVFSGLLLSAMVAERKQVEATLRESEEKYRQLFDAESDAIFLIDNETGQIYEVNSSASKIYGYSHEELVSLRNFDLSAEIDNTQRAMLERQTAIPIRWHRKKDGTVFPVEINVSHLTWRHRPVHIAAIRDITERMRAEESLRASEEKYRTVANFTYDWEAWQAPYGVYLYVSPSCERVTGYTVEEFLADPNLIVDITHPDDRANIIDHFRATISQSRESDSVFDFRIIKKNGETCWINHTCTAVYGEDGKWLGRRESNRDITARRQSEAVLRARLQLSQFADKHTVDEVLEYTLNEAEALTESKISFFHSLDADQKTLTLQMWSTNTLQSLCTAEGKGQHYPIDQAGVWVDCVHKRDPVIYNDYAGLPHRKGLPEGHAPVIRLLTVPVFRNDIIVAILGVGNKQTDYDFQDVKTVSQLADLAWDVVQRKDSEEEVHRTKSALEIANHELQIALDREKKLSHTDPLTGINNRRYLFELAVREFDSAMRYQHPLSVIMFDIDHFKKVNDTFGHDIGDQVLQRVVEAARAELRSSDVIGRYGGEEFVIILPMTTAQQAHPVAERIRASVEALRVPTHKKDAAATLSIGIVELSHAPHEILSVDDLIRCADEAMYTAKQTGRNRISIYEWK